MYFAQKAMRTFLLSILALIVFSCSGEIKPTPLLAYNVAADEVRKRLKDPSSAEFPGSFEKKSHVTGANGIYQIQSWVDAKNGFGGTVRTKWSCYVEFTGPKTYKIDLLEID